MTDGMLKRKNSRGTLASLALGGFSSSKNSEKK
jgi:hypothetical protein